MATVIWFLAMVGIFFVEEVRIRKLKKAYNHDPLTGLCKLHVFEERVFDLIKKYPVFTKCSRTTFDVSPVAIVFIDIDNFKKVNDICGHGAGDKMLQILADIIRNEDLVVRRSGDEFIMALFGLTEKKVGIRLVEMRKQFEVAVSKQFPGIPFPVSFTFGVKEVSRSADMALLEKAVCEAEAEMYKHKSRRGKKR